MAESKRKHKETVIGRKEFVRCINALLESAKRWEAWEKTVGLQIESYGGEVVRAMESLILETLSKNVGDLCTEDLEESWTALWFFEKLYSEKDLVAYLDKKRHRLRSAGQLYDFIQKWKESK